MKINIQELRFKINSTHDSKHPDLLAEVFITFVDEHSRYFICNGFALRKSKFGDHKPYLISPSKKSGNGYYKFNLIDKSLWKEIEKEVIKQYEYKNIPVIEEK